MTETITSPIDVAVDESGTVIITAADGAPDAPMPQLDSRLAGLVGGQLLHAARIAQARTGEPAPAPDANMPTAVLRPTSCGLLEGQDGASIITLFGCGDSRVGFSMSVEACRQLADQLNTVCDKLQPKS